MNQPGGARPSGRAAQRPGLLWPRRAAHAGARPCQSTGPRSPAHTHASPGRSRPPTKAAPGFVSAADLTALGELAPWGQPPVPSRSPAAIVVERWPQRRKGKESQPVAPQILHRNFNQTDVPTYTGSANPAHGVWVWMRVHQVSRRVHACPWQKQNKTKKDTGIFPVLFIPPGMTFPLQLLPHTPSFNLKFTCSSNLFPDLMTPSWATPRRCHSLFGLSVVFEGGTLVFGVPLISQGRQAVRGGWSHCCPPPTSPCKVLSAQFAVSLSTREGGGRRRCCNPRWVLGKSFGKILCSSFSGSSYPWTWACSTGSSYFKICKLLRIPTFLN